VGYRLIYISLSGENQNNIYFHDLSKVLPDFKRLKDYVLFI